LNLEKTMVRKMRLLVAAALILGISVPADAEENFELLKAKQIRARIVGNDISDGVHWSEYYRSDGALISVDMGMQRTGIQLSVYTMKADGFAEVVIDPKTGAIAKAEKITDAEDLDAAATQKAAMEKATTSLFAATRKAVMANAGYQAVSVTPELREGHPTADITLLLGETAKKITEKLD
jgi:hypothetical protein